MAQSFSQWQTTDPTPGATGGGLGPQPFFRSARDQQMASYRVTPEAQYPDGYLGEMEGTRRQQRLIAAGGRPNQHSYQRGIHKGERIDPGDYMWPKEFNLWSAVQAEANGVRFTAAGAVPVVLTNDGKVGPRGINRDARDPDTQAQIDAQRRAQLQRLAPRWK